MRFLLGLDIGGTNVKAALVSSDGVVVAWASDAWSGGSPEDAVRTASRLAASLSSSHPGSTPEAAGCGCAGLVDAERGIVHVSPNLPAWKDVELAKMLAGALGLPTVIENDASAAAYGEYSAGAGRGASNLVMLTLGTGVGGGLVLGGKLYRGSHGTAGEIGHSTVNLDGAPCPCGGRGCLERLVNAESLVSRAASLLAAGRPSALSEVARSRALEAKDIGDAAANGDPVALAAVDETGRVLGVGLANLVQILDPDVIVIGGGVAAAGEALLSRAQSEMAARVQSCVVRMPRVVAAGLGGLSGVVGAALIARERLEPV